MQQNCMALCYEINKKMGGWKWCIFAAFWIIMLKRMIGMSELIVEQLIVVLFIVAGMLVTPVLFIGLDFWAGIRKAKQRGDHIRSDKMRRTVAKISRYYNGVLSMLVVDAIQIAGFVFLHVYNGWTLYTFPVFTLAAVLFVAAIEIKSIWEPADVKESRELREVSELAKAIVEHRQDPKEVAEAIAAYLKKRDVDE